MGVRYSLYDYEIHQNPYPVYAQLREHAPVFHNEEEDVWVLSRHADVDAAYRNHQLFSSSNGVLLEPAAWGPKARQRVSFLAMDPPDHTRMRGLVSKAFTPRRVAELEERVRDIARHHLEEALEKTTFDLLVDYAARVPMDVISELVGVPRTDRAELRRLADAIVHHEPGVKNLTEEGIQALLALVTYFEGLITERKHRRRDDLTSALLDAVDGGDHLTDTEVLGVIFLLIVAGNETTANLISCACYCAWQALDDPRPAFSRIGDWIEETLRLESPAQGNGRRVTRDFLLHATTVPAGSRLLLLIGSANRDPAVFPDPDQFDLGRDTSAKISFGFGPHFCLGAHLARLEARVALEELVSRINCYDVHDAQARRVHSPYVRGFTSLPITVDLRH